MIHIPILRAGRSYRSLNTVSVTHIKTGEPLVEVSQANRGLIAKDLVDIGLQKEALGQRSVAELIAICKAAARLFTTATLPLDGTEQSPTDYIQQVSGTTGLPEALCQQNLLKIQGVLENIDTVLDGLTRGLDLRVLDIGWGTQNGRTLSYVCETDSLGAVLPSNSPGVHSLWVPAIPLKVPLVLNQGARSRGLRIVSHKRLSRQVLPQGGSVSILPIIPVLTKSCLDADVLCFSAVEPLSPRG